VSDLFDVDARAGAFKPVVVKFRGADHTLGATALALIEATSVYTQTPKVDGESDLKHVLRMVRPMLRAMSPTVATEMDARDLDAGEEMAFLPVLTEVVKRLGAIRFHS